MMQLQLTNKSLKWLVAGATALLATLCFIIFAGSVSAHGYVEGPASRAYLCKQGVNQNCGSIIYEPQSLEAPKGFPAAGPVDGKIASANGAFPELDQQSATRWSKVNMTSGTTTFTWKKTAAHSTANWKYYITKAGWNQNAPLAREAFDLTPFCTVNGNNQQPPFTVNHSCSVPSRTGYHIILAVWDVADTTNAFYNVIDVNFGGSSGGDTQAPTVPANLRNTGTTATSVSLAWNASSDNVGVTGYQVRRGSTLLDTVSGSTLNYTATGLSPSTSYSFTVRAVDAAGNVSNASNTLNATTTPAGSQDIEAPTPPQHLHEHGMTSSSVLIMWGPATDNVGVTGYRIYRGGTQIASVSSTTFEYNVTGLTAGSTYTFTVRAIDAAGNLSNPSNSLSVVIGSGTCDHVAAWSASTVYLTGNQVSYNGSIYEARHWTQGDRPDQSGEWGAWKQISDCGDGGHGGHDMQAPTAPTNLTSTGKTSNSVSLSWTASTDNVGVTGYDVFRGSTLVASVSGTTATVSGLSASTSYTFTIKAKDAAGNVSAASPALTVTTNAGSTPPPTGTWAAGVAYKVGDQVTYNGAIYECRQAHTSIVTWEPTNAPALWLKK